MFKRIIIAIVFIIICIFTISAIPTNKSDIVTNHVNYLIAKFKPSKLVM